MYNYEVLKELGDEAEVKAKGKVMTKGKDYVVEYVHLRQRHHTKLTLHSRDGDIILIKAGAAKS